MVGPRAIQAAARSSNGQSSAWPVAVFLPVVIALIALGLRWPYLAILPRFTDETLEVLHSLAIARGEHLPLTNYDSYYGALFNYLIALPLALLGPHPLLPRLTVMVLGAATIVPTYLLGAQVGNRAVGAIAALLVATSSAHIAVNSHIAWSNCLTPLFTTLGFWLLARAQMRSSGPALSGAGLAFGLALQTHPAVVAFAPAVGLLLFTRGMRVIHWRWLGFSVLAFAIGYGNMIAYNLASDFDSIRSAQRMSSEYAQADDADIGAQTGAAMLLLLARLVGGAVDQRSDALSYLLDPGVILGGIACVVGLALLWRRGMVLPALALAAFLLLLPLVNTKFRTLVTIRYLMPAYPLLAVAIGVAIDAGARRLRGRSTHFRAIVVGLFVVAMVVPQLSSLHRHYDRLLRTGDTNERILRLADVIGQSRRLKEMVILDEGMGSELPGTGVTEIRGFRYLLTMSGASHSAVRITPRRLEDVLQTEPSVIAVIHARDAEQVERRLSLQPLEARARAVTGRGSDYQAYRVER